MGIIDNFNCEGICQEAYCNNKYTHILWLTMDEFKFSVLFCEKHYDEIVLKLIDKKIEVQNES